MNKKFETSSYSAYVSVENWNEDKALECLDFFKNKYNNKISIGLNYHEDNSGICFYKYIVSSFDEGVNTLFIVESIDRYLKFDLKKRILSYKKNEKRKI